MVMGSDYPSPDPKFQEQAIALMKQKQDQLNQEYQEQEVNKAEVEKPKAKTTKKTTSKSARGKKTIEKKGASIKKSELETPSAERKPYYIEAEVIVGGAVVGFFAAHKNRPGLEITWGNPRYMAQLEGLRICGANIVEDEKVVDSLDPNTENWKFIENFPRLFLGHPFSGGIVREIDEVE
jgi:hypothetical protein